VPVKELKKVSLIVRAPAVVTVKDKATTLDASNQHERVPNSFDARILAPEMLVNATHKHLTC